MPRKFTLKQNTQIELCPKCGNNTEFTGYSMQCAEDCCEVWVECKCGFDPTDGNSRYRLEDTWGGTSDDLMNDALGIWNDLILEPIKTTT